MVMPEGERETIRNVKPRGGNSRSVLDPYLRRRELMMILFFSWMEERVSLNSGIVTFHPSLPLPSLAVAVELLDDRGADRLAPEIHLMLDLFESAVRQTRKVQIKWVLGKDIPIRINIP
jgi:hypothetical protein